MCKIQHFFVKKFWKSKKAIYFAPKPKLYTMRRLVIIVLLVLPISLFAGSIGDKGVIVDVISDKGNCTIVVDDGIGNIQILQVQKKEMIENLAIGVTIVYDVEDHNKFGSLATNIVESLPEDPNYTDPYAQ